MVQRELKCLRPRVTTFLLHNPRIQTKGFSVGGGGAGYLVCSLLGVILGAGVIFLLILGVLRERSLYLLPHLIAQGFYLVI